MRSAAFHLRSAAAAFLLDLRHSDGEMRARCPPLVINAFTGVRGSAAMALASSAPTTSGSRAMARAVPVQVTCCIRGRRCASGVMVLIRSAAAGAGIRHRTQLVRPQVLIPGPDVVETEARALLRPELLQRSWRKAALWREGRKQSPGRQAGKTTQITSGSPESLLPPPSRRRTESRADSILGRPDEEGAQGEGP